MADALHDHLERLIMIQYEDDESAVKRAIEEAAAEIGHATARTIASWFNDGANTVIYAFVSTGAMVGDTFPTDVLLHEMRKGLDPATERANEWALEALEAYCNEREAYDDLDRVDGWSDMWVAKRKSGTACACRDCVDTVSSDTSKPELCSECREAGCEPCPSDMRDGIIGKRQFECQRDDAYGA